MHYIPKKSAPHCSGSLISSAIKMALFSVGTTLAASNAMALSFQVGEGVSVDLDTVISYDAQWRTKSQSNTLLQQSSLAQQLLSDDGNRNFDKYDMTQNRLGLGLDLDVNFGGNGVFARGRAWYDDVYDDDSLTRQRNPMVLGMGGAPEKRFQRDGLDEHKSDIELLDLYYYDSLSIGDRDLGYKVGRHVVSWGESLFLQGGISSAQGPLDATKANSAGVELKDVFLPLGQVSGDLLLTSNLSLGMYYQWEWDETRIDAPGSYFSVLDVIGQGVSGDVIDLPSSSGQFAHRVTRDKPESGQYGIALRYLAEELNNTEFGLYYLRYNDFTPTIQFAPGVLGQNVILEFFEGIDLYGASFGTVIGETNVSGELSYRSGQPVRLHTPGSFYYSEADTLQAQVSASHLFAGSTFWDSLIVLAEVGHNRVLDIDSDSVASTMGVNVKSKSSALHGDVSASSFTGRVTADYFNILAGLDLKVSINYRNDFNGVSSVPYTFTEGNEIASLRADFTYKEGHSFGVSYTSFLTNPREILRKQGELQVAHMNADRDNAAVYYKYRF